MLAKRQRRLQLLVLALPLTALACGGGEQTPSTPPIQDVAGDETAIRAQVAAYEEAVNRRDAAGVANLYTTDGDFVIYDEPRAVGREVIRSSIQTAMAAWPASMRITLNVTSIRFLKPDLAIVETVATFNEGDIRANRGTSVFVREAGMWLQAALRVYVAQRS